MSRESIKGKRRKNTDNGLGRQEGEMERKCGGRDVSSAPSYFGGVSIA